MAEDTRVFLSIWRTMVINILQVTNILRFIRTQQFVLGMVTKMVPLQTHDIWQCMTSSTRGTRFCHSVLSVPLVGYVYLSEAHIICETKIHHGHKASKYVLKSL